MAGSRRADAQAVGGGVVTMIDPRKHARTSDPATSHAAAAQLSDKATMAARLLVTYLERELTADEAMRAAGYAPADGTWRRVSDLDKLGLIESTGETRLGESGRHQLVRAITTAGVVELARWLR